MKNLLLTLCVLTAMPTMAENSDSAKYYFNKGIEEQSARRYLVAAQAFDKAITFDPNFIDAYLQNGYVNLQMRKTDNAMANFVKVIELDPNNEKAVKELAELYFSYRQFDKAIARPKNVPAVPIQKKFWP
jgi:tetratricopeptide (TPR) repeat protein